MKTATVVRAMTICLALTMLTSYVLYSQLTQNRSVAPGSKSDVIRVQKISRAAEKPLTSSIRPASSEVIASSSKSRAPLITLPAPLFESLVSTNSPPVPTAATRGKRPFNTSITNVNSSTP